MLGALVLAPRFTLIGYGSAGLRIEDALLVLLVPTALRTLGGAEFDTRARGVLMAIALMTVTMLIGSVVNALLGRVSIVNALFFTLRVAEYSVALFAALAVVKIAYSHLDRILLAFTLVNVASGTAQYLDLLHWGVSKFDYSRGAGLTAGPYELGACCSMLAIYWFSKQRYVFAAIAALGVLVSEARISVVALLLGVGFYALRSVRRRWASLGKPAYSGARLPQTQIAPSRVLVVLGAIAAISLTTIATGQFPIGKPGRLHETSVSSSFERGRAAAIGVASPKTATEYAAVSYASLDVESLASGAPDASNIVRFYRWSLLWQTMSSTSAWMLGLGPSFAGASVDGAYLRMLVEGGAVGVLALGFFLFRMAQWERYSGSAVVVTLAATGLFIDIFSSMRTMCVFYLLMACLLHSFETKSSPPVRRAG